VQVPTGNISRHLVREALELAVASLNAELAIEEPEREVSLDHDRKGVPGSPDLANVILEKIRSSHVFVADVTPVGTTPGEPGKKLMNANVAIELGYSLHTVTDRRLIMIMNAAFGTRADLPFDLQHKAGPIFYTLLADATKEQIRAAKKQLAGELKVALREILSGIGSDTVSFQEAAARVGDLGRYYARGQVLSVRRGAGHGPEGQSFYAEETPVLYLRVVPTRSTTALKRLEAVSAIRQGPDHLNPFYINRGGSSFEANEFGAIAFDADYNAGTILSAAQLFLNREIWAFNTVSLSPELATSRRRSLGIPTATVEQTFGFFLPQYVRFIRDKLGVPPPYRIEGGATGVKGYVIFMPSNFFEQEWGPIQDNHVRWSGTLAGANAREIDAALLQIFEAFFDAGACARPEKLYGFPSEPPGKLPGDG
jgi:hypothetical protein